MTSSIKDAAAPNGQADPDSTGSDTAGMLRMDSRHLPELPPTLLEAAQQFIDGSFWEARNGLPASPGDQTHLRDVFSARSASVEREDGKLAAAVAADGQEGQACHPQSARTWASSKQRNAAGAPAQMAEHQKIGDPKLSNAAGNDDGSGRAADGYLSSPISSCDQHGTGAAPVSADAGKMGGAQEACLAPEQQSSDMMRRPAGPLIRLEFSGRKQQAASASAARAQQGTAPATMANHSGLNPADPTGHGQGLREYTHCVPLQAPADPCDGHLGTHIGPKPGRGYSGGGALGQPRGSHGWTVETGRPEAPASPPHSPPATRFAMSDWKLGRGPAKLPFQDPLPLQAARNASGSAHRPSEALHGRGSRGSGGMLEPYPPLPWWSQPGGAGPAKGSQTSSLLWVAREQSSCPKIQPAITPPNMVNGPIIRPASGANQPQGSYAVKESSGAPQRVQRYLPGGPVWDPASAPLSPQTIKPAMGNWFMPLGPDGCMPPAQFEALRALQLQQQKSSSQPGDSEPAALLPRIGLQSVSSDGDKGLRRSGRPSKPARRQDVVDLPSTDEEEGDGNEPHSDEAPQGRRRPGRSIQPIGDPGQEGLTDSQQRLAKRRWHNRESAKRSRSKRQIDAEDQAAKVRRAESQNEQLSQQMATLQWQCCNYSLQLQELQGKHQAATQHCQQLTSQIQELRRQQQVLPSGRT